MLVALRRLEQLLRGEATALPNLQGDRFDLPIGGLSVVLTLLGMIYGACMGLFSLTAAGSQHGMQVLASTVKTPLLFLATLFVTFPSLYVFNAMFGSRLRLWPMLRLMVGSLAVTMAVLSSIGPIVGFFSVSSTSYAFMVLLNVVVFALAGILGLGFLLQTLHRMDVVGRFETREKVPDFATEVANRAEVPKESAVSEESETSVAASEPFEVRSPLSRTIEHAVTGSVWGVFKVWVLIFGLVGAQMAWVLRPFIGNPKQDFTWFRPISGNFFQDIVAKIGHLFGVS